MIFTEAADDYLRSRVVSAYSYPTHPLVVKIRVHEAAILVHGNVLEGFCLKTFATIIMMTDVMIF